jgi:hypothetical protein
MARITIQDLNKFHPFMDSESYFAELTDDLEINVIRGGVSQGQAAMIGAAYDDAFQRISAVQANNDLSPEEKSMELKKASEQNSANDSARKLQENIYHARYA